MILLKKASINRLVKLAQQLKDEGKDDEAIDIARIVVLQDIMTRPAEDDEIIDPDYHYIGTAESTLCGESLELVKIYIVDQDMGVEDAICKVVDMCQDCSNAEYIKWIEKDGKVTTDEARKILNEAGEFAGTSCDYCKDKDIEEGTRRKTLFDT